MITKSRSICFLMPGPNLGPVGGYKIVYEYANRFVAEGWRVAIVFPWYLGALGQENFWKFLVCHPRAGLLCIWGGFWLMVRARRECSQWFPLDSRVKRMYSLYISPSLERKLPKGTKFVATQVLTACALNSFQSPQRYQLVQGLEAWAGMSLDQLHEVYRFKMKKIAIAEWLRDEIESTGEKCAYVPNALDFKKFRRITPVERRVPAEVAVLWNEFPHKRLNDALAALDLVKERHPELHVTAFGVSEKPLRLPYYFTYVQRPDNKQHNDIYNAASIFVAASDIEGWGLTVSEAMMCGCAIACTDTTGFKSFCRSGESALMSPVYDVNALADNICRLIEDDQLRYRIAETGFRNIQQFTWERSFKMLKNVLS